MLGLQGELAGGFDLVHQLRGKDEKLELGPMHPRRTNIKVVEHDAITLNHSAGRLNGKKTTKEDKSDLPFRNVWSWNLTSLPIDFQTIRKQVQARSLSKTLQPDWDLLITRLKAVGPSKYSIFEIKKKKAFQNHSHKPGNILKEGIIRMPIGRLFSLAGTAEIFHGDLRNYGF